MRSVGISFAGVFQVSSSLDILLLFPEVNPEESIVLFKGKEPFSFEKNVRKGVSCLTFLFDHFASNIPLGFVILRG